MRFHIVTLLILAFLGIGALQLVQLPDGLEESVASRQQEIRDRVASQLGDQHPLLAGGETQSSTIALNQPAAKYQWSYFVLVVLAYFLSVRFFKRRSDLLLLATAVAFNGALISVFGIFQKVADADSIYGVPLKFGGAPFSSFVNRNNAAGFLLMCLGCGIAVLVYSYSNLRSRESSESKASLEGDKVLNALMKEIRMLVANLDVWRITLLLVCGLMVAGIALSLSRGGSIALLVSVVFLILFLFRQNRIRSLVLVSLFFVPLTLGAFVWASFQGDVVGRLETLAEDDLLSTENRVQLWKDSLNAVGDYPVLGSGVGSYPYVYKEYQTFRDGSWYFHAENVYLEILVTLGVAGLVCLVGVAVYWWVSAISLSQKKGSSRKPNPKTAAIGLLAIFALVSQAVANFFDFGLLIPANGVLFAVLMGGMVGVLGRQERTESERRPSAFFKLPVFFKWPLVVLLLIGIGNAVYVFWQVQRTEVANQTARSNDPGQFSLEQIEERISQIQAVVDTGVPNLESFEYLAALYVIRFQHELAAYRLENLPAGQPRPEKEFLFDFSSIRILNFQFARLTREMRDRELESIRKLPFFKKNIPAATRCYERALSTCPLSVRSVVGLAELFRLNGVSCTPYLEAFGGYNVQRASWFQRMGDVAVADGRLDAAISLWKSAMSIDSSIYQVVIPTARQFCSDQKVCSELLIDSPAVLVEIADRFYPDPGEFREQIFQRVIGVLGKKAFTDPESNYLMGKARMEVGEVDQAIKNFETATLLAPSRLGWRYELGLLYRAVGDVDSAIKAFRKCVNGDPENKKYRGALERLTAELDSLMP
ncbi:MAG: O-antigen ligase family protein [Planctomycetota bacterium]|nr:O-antigen ligase family protein [Planctomycetota bacterium]